MSLIVDISIATISEEKKGIASAFLLLLTFISLMSVVYLYTNIKRRSLNSQIKLPNLDANNLEKEIKRFEPVTPMTIELVDQREEEFIVSKFTEKENEVLFKKALPYETKSIMKEEFPTGNMPVLENIQIENK